MSDPHGIANALNEYFCNIDNELQAQFTNTDDQYLTYLPEIMQNFFAQLGTASQVKCGILKLNSKKITRRWWYWSKDNPTMSTDVFSQNLSKIYNDSISKGEYPQQMKITRVIAFYNNGKNISPIVTVQLACYLVSIRFLKKYYVDNYHHS